MLKSNSGHRVELGMERSQPDMSLSLTLAWVVWLWESYLSNWSQFFLSWKRVGIKIFPHKFKTQMRPLKSTNIILFTDNEPTTTAMFSDYHYYSALK